MHDNEYLLHQSVIYGDVEAVKSLLQTKALDVNQKDQDGNTALHLAAKRTIELC